MAAPLDVVAFQGSGPKWLGCAETLENALDLIRKTGPGLYFVFPQETQRYSYYEVDSDGALSLLGVYRPR
jgi:hypothetical protein